MKTIESIETWQGLIFLALVFLLIYWILKGLRLLLRRLGKKTVANRSAVKFLEKSLIIYRPIAFLFLALYFISINLLTHTILLVVVGVFGYKHIKNYINGTFLRLNPLIDEGALIEHGKIRGEIKQLLTDGVILSTESGERYINYSSLEEKGFAVNSNKHTTLRQTIYVETMLNKEELLDLLFDNPIFDFKERPTLKSSAQENYHIVQYTLESGATNDDLVAFLLYNNITFSSTNPTSK